MFDVGVTLRLRDRSGAGRTHDMSVSGVRIEQPTLVPPVGTPIRLKVGLFEDSPPMPLSGRVVRLTVSGGFCVEFDRVTSRSREVLRAVLPRVTAERQSVDPATLLSGELLVTLGRELQWACTQAAQVAQIPVNQWIKGHLQAAAAAELEDAKRSSRPRTCPQCSRSLPS